MEWSSSRCGILEGDGRAWRIWPANRGEFGTRLVLVMEELMVLGGRRLGRGVVLWPRRERIRTGIRRRTTQHRCSSIGGEVSSGACWPCGGSLLVGEVPPTGGEEGHRMEGESRGQRSGGQPVMGALLALGELPNR